MTDKELKKLQKSLYKNRLIDKETLQNIDVELRKFAKVESCLKKRIKEKDQIVAYLWEIKEKQLTKQPLTATDSKFINWVQEVFLPAQ